jgi:regulator of replication initiation timing
MNDQLSSLEQRIDQLLGHFTQVRGENHDLRIRVANLESENKRLREKIGYLEFF